jgi:hypothetical protein
MLNNSNARYHRRIDERPGSQNASRVVVSGNSVTAIFTYKLALICAVGLFTMTTVLASSRTVFWVNEKNGNAKSRGFVCNLGNQISERPISMSRPLSASDLCLSDIAQIFQSNRPSSVVRLLHNTLGNTVIGVFLIPRLTTRDFLEFPFCRTGLFVLKILPTVSIFSPFIFNIFTREGLTVTINGKIDDANIYAQKVGEIHWFGRFDKTRCREIKFSIDEGQVGLTNFPLQEFQLMFSGNKTKFQTSIESPNRNNAFIHSPREQVLVIFDCSKWSEYPFNFLINFICLSDLRGTTYNDTRTKTLESFSCFVIRGFMQGELREDSEFPCLLTQVVATFVGGTNRFSKSFGLLGSNNQLHFSDELHDSI